jgi:hypothetical protein
LRKGGKEIVKGGTLGVPLSQINNNPSTKEKTRPLFETAFMLPGQRDSIGGYLEKSAFAHPLCLMGGCFSPANLNHMHSTLKQAYMMKPISPIYPLPHLGY